jgi:hypothetical protein
MANFESLVWSPDGLTESEQQSHTIYNTLLTLNILYINLNSISPNYSIVNDFRLSYFLNYWLSRD